MSRDDHFTVIDDVTFTGNEETISGIWDHTLFYFNRNSDSPFYTEERRLRRIYRKGGHGWESSSDCWRKSDSKRRNAGRHRHYDFNMAKIEALVDGDTVDAARTLNLVHGISTGRPPRQPDVERFLTASPTQRAIGYAGLQSRLKLELETGIELDARVVDDGSRSREVDTRRLKVNIFGLNNERIIYLPCEGREYGVPRISEYPADDDSFWSEFPQEHDLETDAVPIDQARDVTPELRAGKYGTVSDTDTIDMMSDG